MTDTLTDATSALTITRDFDAPRSLVFETWASQRGPPVIDSMPTSSPADESASLVTVTRAAS